MGLYRSIYEHLRGWKLDIYRKPLVLRGARQVGKTTVVKEFGQEYDHFLYFNLEREGDRKIFEETDDIPLLVDRLFLRHQKVYDPSKSNLIFIDEVQESPLVINQLRYFYEERPDLHIIASGSLLEFAFTSNTRVPVGRVEFMTLHPLNFEEYLLATNKPAYYKIKEVPVPAHVSPMLFDLFHEYLIIGGMPEVVQRYVETRQVSQLSKIYRGIMGAYHSDIDKYAPSKAGRAVLRSMLAKLYAHVGERITLGKFAGTPYKARETGEALKTLQEARLIWLNYPTVQTSIPASPSFTKRPKLLHLDTGLVNYQLGIQGDLIGYEDMNEAHRGRIMEQLIYQELRSKDMDPFRWDPFWVRSKGDAEVDLLLKVRQMLIPVEIKSGPTGKLRSLNEFMDRCDHHLAIRMYRGTWLLQDAKTRLGKQYKLLNIPYFMATQLEIIAQWYVKEYG